MGSSAVSPVPTVRDVPPVLVKKHPFTDDILLPRANGKKYNFLMNFTPPRDWLTRETSRREGMSTFLHEAIRRNMIEWQIHQLIKMMDRPTATSQSQRPVADLIKAIWNDKTIGTGTQLITFHAFNKVVRGIVRLSNSMKIIDNHDTPEHVEIWLDNKVEPDWTPINVLREQASAMREEIVTSKLALQDALAQSAELAEDTSSTTDEMELLRKQVLFYKIGAGYGAGGVSLRKQEVTAFFRKILEDAPIMFEQFRSTLDGAVGFDRDMCITMDTFELIWQFYNEHVKGVHVLDLTTREVPVKDPRAGSRSGVIVKNEPEDDMAAKRRRKDGGGHLLLTPRTASSWFSVDQAIFSSTTNRFGTPSQDELPTLLLE